MYHVWLVLVAVEQPGTAARPVRMIYSSYRTAYLVHENHDIIPVPVGERHDMPYVINTSCFFEFFQKKKRMAESYAWFRTNFFAFLFLPAPQYLKKWSDTYENEIKII